MDLKKDRKKLMEFFLEFGAENNLDEAHVEKLERVLHVIKPKSMVVVRKVCEAVVIHNLKDLPEDEIIDHLKEDKLIK